MDVSMSTTVFTKLRVTCYRMIHRIDSFNVYHIKYIDLLKSREVFYVQGTVTFSVKANNNYV